jgi:hypothetical protein
MYIIILLVALGIGAIGFFVGWLFGDPTLGTLLMGAAILGGVAARMNQAGEHQAELLAALREASEREQSLMP